MLDFFGTDCAVAKININLFSARNAALSRPPLFQTQASLNLDANASRRCPTAARSRCKLAARRPRLSRHHRHGHGHLAADEIAKLSGRFIRPSGRNRTRPGDDAEDRANARRRDRRAERTWTRHQVQRSAAQGLSSKPFAMHARMQRSRPQIRTLHWGISVTSPIRGPLSNLQSLASESHPAVAQPLHPTSTSWRRLLLVALPLLVASPVYGYIERHSLGSMRPRIVQYRARRTDQGEHRETAADISKGRRHQRQVCRRRGQAQHRQTRLPRTRMEERDGLGRGRARRPCSSTTATRGIGNYRYGGDREGEWWGLSHAEPFLLRGGDVDKLAAACTQIARPRSCGDGASWPTAARSSSTTQGQGPAR